MDRSLPKILKYLLCATVAGVLLYYSFRDVNWSDFVAGLKACQCSAESLPSGSRA